MGKSTETKPSAKARTPRATRMRKASFVVPGGKGRHHSSPTLLIGRSRGRARRSLQAQDAAAARAPGEASASRSFPVDASRARRSVLLDGDLVERCPHAFGEPLCIIVRPEMHEEEARLVVEHVVM